VVLNKVYEDGYCPETLQCATSLKVSFWIRDQVNGFLDLPNPSSLTDPGVEQPLTEISTSNLSGVNGRPAGA
jgi:hypothetical protein